MQSRFSVQSNYTAMLIALTIAQFILLFAWPAVAQPAVAPTTDVLGFALGEIIRTGVMGAIAVVEAFVIRSLFREMNGAKAQFQTFAIEQMKVLAKNNEVLDRVERKLTPGGS